MGTYLISCRTAHVLVVSSPRQPVSGRNPGATKLTRIRR